MVVRQCRGELARPVNPAAIDHHDDVFTAFPKDLHHLMDILTELLGIEMWHELIEDPRGAILDRANHVEQDATGDTTPSARGLPGLTFEGLLLFDLTLGQR